MFRKILTVVVIMVALAATGCTKTGTTTPEGVLRDYVTKAFDVKDADGVQKLIDLSTGTAKEELEKLKDNADLIQQHFVDEKKSIAGSIKIRDERKLSDDRYSIIYELTYKNMAPATAVNVAPRVLPATLYKGAPEGGEGTANKEATEDKVTIKKNAILIKENDSWKISEVQNIKTFVEHTTEEKISAEPKR